MKTIRVLAIALIGLYISGCAAGATVPSLTYDGDQKTYASALKNNIHVADVMGGRETNPAWTSQISDQAFISALRNTLELQQLLNPNGRYQLDVFITNLKQPLVGLDMTATLTVEYSILDKENNTVVFNETISASHTATVGDAFVGTKRLQLATEGAGRNNIAAFLEELAIQSLRRSGTN